MSYLGAPLITPFINRFPRLQRKMIWVGCEYRHFGFDIFWLTPINRANLHPWDRARLLLLQRRDARSYSRRSLRSGILDILLPYPQHGERVLDRPPWNGLRPSM